MDEERSKRHDLTDAEWALIARLLPSHPRQGRRWSDHRLVIDGVFHRARTGTPWRDLPERFGPYQTVYGRHRRWSADGTWERILSTLQAGSDQAEGADWSLAVDSTEAHRTGPQGSAGSCRGAPASTQRSSLAKWRA